MKKHPHVYDWEQRKILLLSNRVALKEQLQATYGSGVEELVDFMNYQALIHKIKMGEPIPKHDFIIADECHYFLSDAIFSCNTDIALDFLIKDCTDCLIVYLSATPKLFISYMEQYHPGYFTYAYKVKKRQPLAGCYIWEDEAMLWNRLSKIPKGEKILFFRNNIKKNWELREHLRPYFKTAAICSIANPANKRYCDIEELKKIKTTSQFQADVLIATTTLDNGISIVDNNLKHIIVDLLDLDTIVQCIGRKRMMEDDELHLYIKRPNKGDIMRQKEKINGLLEITDVYRNHSLEEFCRMYGRENLHGMLYPVVENAECQTMKYQVNHVKKFKLIQDRNFLNQLLFHQSLPFVWQVLQYGNYESDSYIQIDDETIKDIGRALEVLVNKPLPGEDKKLIATTINRQGYPILAHSSHIQTYQNFFDKYWMPFVLESNKYSSGEKKGQRYWKLRTRSSSELVDALIS